MFTAATYNVLATCHLPRGDYSRVPTDLLDPARRTAAVARHVAALDADLLMLQEVEAAVFAALKEALPGHEGRLELRDGGRAEGCALFWRKARFDPLYGGRLDYPGDDGRVAVVQVFSDETHRLIGAASTHLTWDRPGVPASAQAGHRQAETLLESLAGAKPPPRAVIVGGDFNRPPEGEVLALFARAGFANAHAGGEAPTCLSRGRPRQIDFLLHSQALAPEPAWPPPLPAVMPCAGQPSDHLPLAAAFRWRESAVRFGGIRA